MSLTIKSTRFSPNLPWDEDQHSLTISQLNELVVKISQWKGLAWDNPHTGCLSRAMCIADFLHRSGVSIKHLSFMVVGSVDALLNNGVTPHGHINHVAAFVSGFAVDCLLNPNEVIPEKQWIENMGISLEEFKKLPDEEEFFHIYPSKSLAMWSKYPEFIVARLPISCYYTCTEKYLTKVDEKSGEETIILDPDGCRIIKNLEFHQARWTVREEVSCLKRLEELCSERRSLIQGTLIHEEPQSDSALRVGPSPLLEISLHPLPPGVPHY